MKGIAFFLLLHVLTYPFASCSSYQIQPETDTLIASWYGAEFHGRPTSSGETFDMFAYTCAHRDYPFGTRLKVTHVSTGKSVTCLVNDRGPFVDGRDIDLSYAAARDIGLIASGTSPVTIQHMGRDSSFIRTVAYRAREGILTIQTGSFRERENALRLKSALERKYTGVYIDEANVQGSTFYRVRIGRFASRSEALSLAEILANEGYAVLITQYDEKT